MDRSAWLRERRTGIGSSDAPAVCGLSPWGTPLHVYLDKLGQLPPRESPALDWGHRLEPIVACAYAEHTGRQVVPPALMLQRHPVHPWLLASLDRLSLTEAGDVRILECKTARTAEGWGQPGTDEVPEAYLVQVQHQMLVCGVDQADLAVLIGGSDFRIYSLFGSAEVQSALLTLERDLWQRIERREPPSPDWTHPETPRLLDLLYRPDGALEVEFPWSDLVSEYERLGVLARETEHRRESIKGEIIHLLREAGIGRLPDGRRVQRKLVERKEYTVARSTYIDFKILKARA